MSAFELMFQALFQRHGGSLEFGEAATLHLSYPNRTSAYAARARGSFPVPTRLAGSKIIVGTADLAAFLTGEAAPCAPPGRRPGRPTKRQQLEKAAAAGQEVSYD